MPQYRLSKKAQADVNEIIDFYTQNTNEVIASATIDTLFRELQKLANSTLLKGRRVERMPKHFRRWNILKSNYQVYFKRAKNGNLWIYRIYGSKRQPLKPEDLK